MSRGLRNNNPLNIRHNSQKYLGEVPGTDRSFKSFRDMAYGYRAAFVTLGTYLTTGRNTIVKIISSWAPASENNTQAYIAAVEKGSGISRNRVLTLKDGKDIIAIVAAMAKVENGVPAVMADVDAGYKLQSKITG